MGTVFVERVGGAKGPIRGVFASRQPGTAEEAVDELSPEVVEFLRPPSAAERDARDPGRAEFRALVAAALQTNDAFLSAAAPGAADVALQVQRLTAQISALLHRFAPPS